MGVGGEWPRPCSDEVFPQFPVSKATIHQTFRDYRECHQDLQVGSSLVEQEEVQEELEVESLQQELGIQPLQRDIPHGRKDVA